MLNPQEILNRLIDKNEIFYDEMTELMQQIMRGEMAPEIIAALLIGLRIKVETVSEITAAVNVLKQFSVQVPSEQSSDLIDIVGTGGDGIKTFNISTTAMFVVAAMGVKVAKHGGKAVSSSSGAADVVETMGVNINLTPGEIAQSIAEENIGFMYAPKHNPAMRHVAPVRQVLGVRTLFNILGPLTNPANAKNQLLGVFHPDLLGICSHVSKEMGMRRVMVVNGHDGMDEITITGPSSIAELKNGVIERYEVHPEQFNIPVVTDISELQVTNTQESLRIIDEVLDGRLGSCRDIVLLNSAAALYCAGAATSMQEGIEMAKESIDSKKAQQKKATFIQFTNQFSK